MIGFVIGLLVDLTKPGVTRSRAGKRVAGGGGSDGTGEELKMVCVVCFIFSLFFVELALVLHLSRYWI